MSTPPKGQNGPLFGLSRSEKDAFPQLYGTAAAGSRHSQKWYFRVFGGELIAVVVAAFSQFLLRPLGLQIADFFHFRLDDVHLHFATFSYDFSSATVSSTIAGSFVPAIAVLVVLLFTGVRYYVKLDEKWHAQRSLAEAVVELVWRYSMRALTGDLPGAIPQEIREDAENADAAGYIDAYEALLQTAAGLDLPPPANSGPIITLPMRRLRNANWVDKRMAYLRDRLDDQMHFYLEAAQRYHRARNRLRWAMIGCYIIGGLLLPFNGLGALTTAAGALGTWLGAKHFSDLALSYTAMQRELEVLRTRADDLLANDPMGEGKWSQLVDNVESKLEGEHQDWLRRLGQ